MSFNEISSMVSRKIKPKKSETNCSTFKDVRSSSVIAPFRPSKTVSTSNFERLNSIKQEYQESRKNKHFSK